MMANLLQDKDDDDDEKTCRGLRDDWQGMTMHCQPCLPMTGLLVILLRVAVNPPTNKLDQ